MATLEFWFEFASTYSYPAAMRIEAMVQRQGIAMTWQPFLLGPIFQQQGWSDSPFNLYPVQGRYMWRDMERICADLGLPWRQPSIFPRHSVLAAQVACVGAAEVWLPTFIRQVFQANFVDDLDISRPDIIQNCLDHIGLSGVDIIRHALMPGNKAQLRSQTERAIALGLFGAPTFMVGQELFWGNDRLESALAWANGTSLSAHRLASL